MFAFLLLFLCLGGIVGHRLDDVLFKPMMDIVGTEISSAISKTSLVGSHNRDEDAMLLKMAGANDGDGVQRHNAVGRKDLLQHLYAAYGCLSSVERWTKSKANIDFELKPQTGFDCKRYARRKFATREHCRLYRNYLDVLHLNRYEPNIDGLVNGIAAESFDENDILSTDGRKMEHAVIKDMESRVDKRHSNFPSMSYYADFYKNLLKDTNVKETKRAGTAPVIGCDCKVKIDLVDLGQQHYPRYLMNAVCQSNHSPNEYPQKCWRGSFCKPLEYKVKVLTTRNPAEQSQNDPALAWLPDELRQNWKFKTVTIAAGCFCSY